MAKLDSNKLGLTLGIFLALLHAAWSLLIALAPGAVQGFVNWVFTLHRIQPSYAVLPFNLASALMLVAYTFVLGYALGWLLATIWNKLR